MCGRTGVPCAVKPMDDAVVEKTVGQDVVDKELSTSMEVKPKTGTGYLNVHCVAAAKTKDSSEEGKAKGGAVTVNAKDVAEPSSTTKGRALMSKWIKTTDEYREIAMKLRTDQDTSE